jgi:hypothetical protein
MPPERRQTAGRGCSSLTGGVYERETRRSSVHLASREERESSLFLEVLQVSEEGLIHREEPTRGRPRKR